MRLRWRETVRRPAKRRCQPRPGVLRPRWSADDHRREFVSRQDHCRTVPVPTGSCRRGETPRRSVRAGRELAARTTLLAARVGSGFHRHRQHDDGPRDPQDIGLQRLRPGRVRAGHVRRRGCSTRVCSHKVTRHDDGAVSSLLGRVERLRHRPGRRSPTARAGSLEAALARTARRIRIALRRDGRLRARRRPRRRDSRRSHRRADPVSRSEVSRRRSVTQRD